MTSLGMDLQAQQRCTETHELDRGETENQTWRVHCCEGYPDFSATQARFVETRVLPECSHIYKVGRLQSSHGLVDQMRGETWTKRLSAPHWS